MLAQGISEMDAAARVEDALSSGAAFGALKSIVAAQGGDVRVLDDLALMPSAPITRMVTATTAGYVQRIPARAIGEAVVRLGGGRAVKSDVIDHRVGIETLVHIGDSVACGDGLFKIYAASEVAATDTEALLVNAISIAADSVDVRPVVFESRT